MPFEVLEHLSSNTRLYNVILENYPSLLTCRSTSEKGLNNIDSLKNTARVPVTFSMKLKKTKKPKQIIHQVSLFIFILPYYFRMFNVAFFLVFFTRTSGCQ